MFFLRILLDPAWCSTLYGSALLAFGASEKLDSVFRPTPSTPDPQAARDTPNPHDANEWRVAMDIEIENMRRIRVSTAVPRPLNPNIITPRCVFHRKFENGLLAKHKARTTQVPGVEYNDTNLYALVM